MHDMKHMDFLEEVTRYDLETLRRKEASYQGSWKKRGGIGAFMMLARKWDRLESIVSSISGTMTLSPLGPEVVEAQAGEYDIFSHILLDTSGADGTALAEVRDLREYLLLVEAEILSRTHGRKKLAEKDFGLHPREEVIPRPISSVTPVPEKVYAHAHSDSSHGAEFPIQDRNEPCNSYHSTIVNGLCQNCGFPSKAHPVPVEDSNKHAKSEDWRAGKQQEDGTWAVRPVISADLYHRLQDGGLKGRYIVTGKFAQVNRMLYPPEVRGIKFKPFPQTLTKMDSQRLSISDLEFYEPRPDVEGEIQLKKEYREGWGA